MRPMSKADDVAEALRDLQEGDRVKIDCKDSVFHGSTGTVVFIPFEGRVAVRMDQATGLPLSFACDEVERLPKAPSDPHSSSV